MIKKYFMLTLLVLNFALFSFGKNKVQYHDFKWKCKETKHFLIYYYEGGEYLSDFCGRIAENSYKYLRRDFLYEIKSKISIIIYNSHNHFEETNTMGGIPEESVGGFTEFFKNRVVIPFPGDWEGFRHVIHHELTHAVQNQMLFGTSYQSIVGGINQARMPLWLIEGLAEYESRGGWDSESDMNVRDAVYNDYLPNINSLAYYLVYKGGQNLIYYISERFGSRKIGDIIRNISIFSSTTNSFKDALGLSFEDLSKDWHRWIREKYLKSFAKEKQPTDIADKLSDHKKYHNFINNSPAISPDGLKIAFLSNKSDYFDIYLMRTLDGKIINKIVGGQSSADFEEFHWLMPGICWSPDSKYIAFAAKNKDADALYIYDALKGKQVKKIKFKLDGVFAPDWSKKGDLICFSGLKDGRTDIYTYNMKTENLTQITNDIYSDSNPKFSSSGDKIIFSSDRSINLDYKAYHEVPLYSRNNNLSDIYYIDLKKSKMKRLTTNEFSETYPFWIDEDQFGYISNENGVSNIYKQKISEKSGTPLSDLITGCTQVNYSNNRLAFTSLFEAGYDVYLVDDFQSLKPIKDISNGRWYSEKVFKIKDNLNTDDFKYYGSKGTNLKKITFGKDLYKKNTVLKETEKGTPIFYDEAKRFTILPKDYKISFTPDIITLNAGYNNSYGFAGNAFVQLSDQLSNHRIIANLSLDREILNSDINLIYYYLKRRVNFGMGLSHNISYYVEDNLGNSGNYFDDDLFKDRLISSSFLASYPISRYMRFDFNLSFKNISNSKYISDDEFKNVKTNNLLTSKISFSYDTSIWGIVGPENGSRVNFSYIFCPKNTDFLQSSGTYEFNTFKFDVRKYFRLYRDFQFAVKFSGGASFGRTPQNFLIGGTSNWINYRVNNAVSIKGVNEKYYSFVDYPLRGEKLYVKKGNRFAILNAEFRYPFINYLSLGAPLPITIGYIKGVLFSDIGSAWNDDDFRGVKYIKSHIKLNDLLYSGGIGTRVNLGYFILKYDIAWRWDFYNNPSSPCHVISLGTNF